MEESFIYTQLDKSKTGSFRILKLQPGEKEAPIVCNLIHARLDVRPPSWRRPKWWERQPTYEAISYVWGSPDRPVSINCDGKRLYITENLKDALVRVRLPDRPRSVWADSVCIDQDNLDEKAHQVQFMGMIYSNASRVLICLGEDDEGHAQKAMSLVKDVSNMVAKTITEMTGGPPTVLCFPNLGFAEDGFSKRQPLPRMRLFSGARLNAAGFYLWTLEFGFISVGKHFVAQKTSLQRHTHYFTKVLAPTGCESVYTEFAVAYLQATRDLNLLQCVQHTDESIELSTPSWVPLWNIDEWIFVADAGLKRQQGSTAHFTLEQESGTPRLTVQALLFDTVRFASDPLLLETVEDVAQLWQIIWHMDESADVQEFLQVLCWGRTSGGWEAWKVQLSAYGRHLLAGSSSSKLGTEDLFRTSMT
ncbi:het domain-containing protein [Diaporthe eres]|nr:het domain-containing protein [Diaporthe eres]